jgi:hypothetical protein
MTFFNYSVPPLGRQQLNMDVQELEGLWQVQLPLGKERFYSKFYTCLDRACLLRSLLLIPMFGTAQFFPVSWMLQAGLWPVLGLVGTAAMVSMTYSWVKIERLTGVLYGWVVIRLLGLLLTDLGIFLGWGKSVAESLSPVVGNERNSVFGYWIRRAIARAFSSKFVSTVGDFNCALHRRLVFPIYGSSNGI